MTPQKVMPLDHSPFAVMMVLEEITFCLHRDASTHFSHTMSTPSTGMHCEESVQDFLITPTCHMHPLANVRFCLPVFEHCATELAHRNESGGQLLMS